MKWTVVLIAVLATARVASAQCPPCAESWQTPDANCYCALHECKAGNPRCDVDVEGLAALPCDQIITTSTAPTNDWSVIDWSHRVICIEAGDHTGRGDLDVAASGTAGARKVLRYTRASDDDDEPWHQSTGNKAKVSRLYLAGYSAWLVHRLTFDGDATASHGAIYLTDGNNDIVFNRILAEDYTYTIAGMGADGLYVNDRNTIQNSVLRKAWPSSSGENQIIETAASPNLHIINNELYDGNKATSVGDGNPSIGGGVFENNDVYTSADFYTDCNGNYDAAYPNPCAPMEVGLGFKAAGTAAAPVLVTHNRVWGLRDGDGVLSGGGQTGPASPIVFSAYWNGTGADYMVIQNNIIWDSSVGIANYHGQGSTDGANLPPDGPNNVDIVGNLIYDIYNHTPDAPNGTTAGVNFWRADEVAVYANTVLEVDGPWLAISSGQGESADNADARCNVAVNAAGGLADDGGTGHEHDRNIYYGGPHADETNRISNAVTARANATAHGVGDIIRLSTSATTSCTAATDADCFLYRVTSAGTSAATVPAYCTTLGCTTQDGTMTVQAIRGPYCFYRKLRTSPEQVCIPYAVPHESAPEYGFCRSENMGGVPLGSRPGIGINDEVAPY